MTRYKVEQIKNVYTEKFVCTTDALKEIDNMMTSGNKDHALPYISALISIASENGDEKLLKDCQRRMSEITLPYKFELYDKGGAADPNNKPKEPKEKGRPKALAFEDYLKDDAPKGLMDILEGMLEGKTGKSAFTIILAASEWFKEEPLPQSVIYKFESVKKTPYNDARDRHYGYNIYMGRAVPIPDHEVSHIRENIRAKLNERG